MAGAFLYRNLIAEPGVQISSPVFVPPGMPVSNLFDPQPRVRARFGVSGNATIVVDLGTQRAVECVFAGSTNAGADALVRVRLSATDPTATLGEVWNTGVLLAHTDAACNGQVVVLAPPQRTVITAEPLTTDAVDLDTSDITYTTDAVWRTTMDVVEGFMLLEDDGGKLLLEDGSAIVREDAVWQPGEPASAVVTGAPVGRYLQIDITDPSRAAIDIGILAVGELLRPRIGMLYGMAEGRRILDRSDRNPFTGSQFRVRALGNPRRMRFTQTLMTQGDALAAWRDMIERLGAAGDALWIPELADDPAEMNRRSIWGAVAQPGNDMLAERTDWARLTRSFDIEERL